MKTFSRNSLYCLILCNLHYILTMRNNFFSLKLRCLLKCLFNIPTSQLGNRGYFISFTEGNGDINRVAQAITVRVARHIITCETYYSKTSRRMTIREKCLPALRSLIMQAYALLYGGILSIWSVRSSKSPIRSMSLIYQL